MSVKKISALAFFVVLAMMSGCTFSFSTARITDAKLSKEVNEKLEAVAPTTTFSSTDPIIHAVVILANAPDSTKVKAIWTAVKVEGVEPDKMMGETELQTDGKDIVDFTFKPTAGGLPPGEYKVDIYLNPQAEKKSEPDKTLTFSVTQDPATATLPGGESSGLSIVEAIITLEEGGKPVTEVPSDVPVIYGYAKLGPGSGNAIVSAKWILVNAEGEQPGTVMVETTPLTLEAGDTYKTSLTLSRQLPVGEYKIDFYLNNSSAPAFSAPYSVPE